MEERMTAVAQGPNVSLWSLALDPEVRSDAPRTAETRKNDAQIGIREVEALRQIDVVAPAELAELAEPLVKLFAGELTSGDHLRLPQLTSHDGTSLQAPHPRHHPVTPAPRTAPPSAHAPP